MFGYNRVFFQVQSTQKRIRCGLNCDIIHSNVRVWITCDKYYPIIDTMLIYGYIWLLEWHPSPLGKVYTHWVSLKSNCLFDNDWLDSETVICCLFIDRCLAISKCHDIDTDVYLTAVLYKPTTCCTCLLNINHANNCFALALVSQCLIQV